MVNRVVDLWDPWKANNFLSKRLFASPEGFCTGICVWCKTVCLLNIHTWLAVRVWGVNFYNMCFSVIRSNLGWWEWISIGCRWVNVEYTWSLAKYFCEWNILKPVFLRTSDGYECSLAKGFTEDATHRIYAFVNTRNKNQVINFQATITSELLLISILSGFSFTPILLNNQKSMWRFVTAFI
jgi:hypothetical protein